MPFGLRRSDLLALIAAGAFFMEGLDASIIAPAIPKMAESFGTNPIALTAGISAYLITVAIFVPASGWASDRFGVRNVFCCAIGLFAIASVGCAFSTTLSQFTLARIVQGAAGAMMSPVGRSAVLRKTEKRHFLRATALVTWPGLASFMIGPPIGGFIATYWSWPWIFLINVPIGLFGILMVLKYFENDYSHRRPFDAIGFVLNGGSLALLMYGLNLIGHNASEIAMGGGLIAAGFVVGIFAFRHARRDPHPLLSPAPFKAQTFLLATLWGGIPLRFTVASTSLVFPLMFQIAFGLNAFVSGLLMLAIAGGDLGIKALTPAIVRRFGFRQIMIRNGWLIALSTLACAAFGPTTPVLVMAPILVMVGAFRSIQFTATSAVTFADIPPAGMPNASALFSMFHQLSFGIGVAVAALLLTLFAALHGTPTEPNAFDFRLVICAMAASAFISVLVYTRLDSSAGAAVRGERGESYGSAE